MAGIPEYARAEEATFLSYPEWYIVWSYQEKSDFQQKRLPSAFPYFGAVAQYWRGYCCINEIVRSRYPFNFGEHLMLGVIGTSFSLEYAMKGLYENTVGRFTEWTAGHQPAQEDLYAAHVAKEYADFVHIRPFYEFQFFHSLKGLWKENTLWGPHEIRKLERRIWLTLDYAAEGLYCGLITWASHSTYGVETDQTYAILAHAPESIFSATSHVRKTKDLGPGEYVAALPRYQEFTDVALRLARQGVTFTEIAGNGQVLLTALAPKAASFDLPGAELLFATEILTDSNRQRWAIRIPVPSLHTILQQLGDQGIYIEHIYDY